MNHFLLLFIFVFFVFITMSCIAFWILVAVYSQKILKKEVKK